MKSKSCLVKKKFYVVPALVAAMTLLVASLSSVYGLSLGGKPVTVSGYLNQGVQWGIGGDHFDTQEGFQSALTQFLLELKYNASPDLTVFASGYLNADLAYPLLDSNGDWKRRRFDQSKSELAILNEDETMLKELHATYSKGDWIFRLGKQIVAWGETDGVRLMDQINPLDTRRGISDVEFETTIIPIWLAKAEYFPEFRPSWMGDLALEFVLNPNARFIADKSFGPGNEVSGIWGVDVTVPSPAPGFLPDLRIGSIDSQLDEPRNWDHKGWEFGFRTKSLIGAAFVTLNYFNGRENAPVTRGVPPFLRLEDPLDPSSLDNEGRLIAHPTVEGFFPRQQFAGFTFSRDIASIRPKFLGGVSPLIRFEAFYGFGRTFVTDGKNPLLESFEKHDEIRYAIGIDWKIRIPFLNPRDGISLSGQFIQQHVNNFPKDYGLFSAGGLPVKKDNYTTTLLARTSYLHQKLVPMIFWQRTYQGSVKGDLILAQLGYEYTDQWNFTLQGVLLEKKGFEVLDHKDNISFTVGYRF